MWRFFLIKLYQVFYKRSQGAKQTAVLFLAKSFPAISYRARYPQRHLLASPLCFAFAPCSSTTPSFQGKNMSFSSPHATTIRGDLRAELKEARGRLVLPICCLLTVCSLQDLQESSSDSQVFTSSGWRSARVTVAIFTIHVMTFGKTCSHVDLT